MTQSQIDMLFHVFDLLFWAGVITGFFVLMTLNGLIGLVRTYRANPSLHRWSNS